LNTRYIEGEKCCMKVSSEDGHGQWNRTVLSSIPGSAMLLSKYHNAEGLVRRVCWMVPMGAPSWQCIVQSLAPLSTGGDSPITLMHCSVPQQGLQLNSFGGLVQTLQFSPIKLRVVQYL
jgi:hypothetical protein